ncbi:cytosolic phospholipase A2 gamma-like isoform X1 [Amia ocellicauda]|uniref:cytosolic phospholipase A2 gamma-like isoform X1 n=2 Tax=Amia ocellicauda TaxID=2972642 RepID=UPI0034639B67
MCKVLWDRLQGCGENDKCYFHEADVPQIAVLGSGGGLRAMVALMGTLSELGAQKLLDSIQYLCGVSGSTWCMSSLYNDEKWSLQVEQKEAEMVEKLTSKEITFQDIIDRINEATRDSNFSLTDIWAALYVYPVVRDKETKSVSDQTDKEMLNPYPIYAAIDRWRLENKDKHDKGIWFEITRHESGYPGCGAFIETSKFGSIFKEGEILEERDEMDLLYLKGLCGSALGSWKESKKFITSLIKGWIKSIPGFNRMLRGRATNESVSTVDPNMECMLLLLDLHEAFNDGMDCKPIVNALMALQEGNEEAQKQLQQVLENWDQQSEAEQVKTLSDLCQEMCLNYIDQPSLEEALTLNSISNVISLKVMTIIFCLLFEWTWGTKFNFLHKHPNPENVLPSDLVQDEKIYLIDAGLAINCGYPLVLRPERQVQLILSFDFSAGDPFLTVHQAAEYCQQNNIPFPDIPVVSEEEKACPSDCYIYSEEDMPTVMHFPLFNKANCGDAEEIKEMWNLYSTARRSYSKKEIQDLLEFSKSNVRRNGDQIIAEMQKAVEAVLKKQQE